ncbi:MAG: amino acid--tRNA ligase-related protein, partial [Collinsella aerofaciens]
MDRLPRGRLHQQPHRQVLLGRGDGRSARAHGRRARRPCDVRRRPRLLSDEILGGMRSHMANALEIKREGHDFLWVVNFPLFHWDEDRKAYAAEHQPFTLPTETDIAKIEADPLAAGSCTYDFVMDGFEAGGGGMRIHNAEMQMSM